MGERIPAVHARAAAPRPRADWRRILYFQLHVLGFLATTMLLSWGLFALVLLGLGGFSLDGMMAQLDNLASRYVAADAVRQMQFKQWLGGGQLILGGALILLRRHRLLPPDLARAAHV